MEKWTLKICITISFHDSVNNKVKFNCSWHFSWERFLVNVGVGEHSSLTEVRAESRSSEESRLLRDFRSWYV
jgi:hypothetical protein